MIKDAHIPEHSMVISTIYTGLLLAVGFGNICLPFRGVYILMMAIPLQAGYVLELGKYVLALPLFPILLAVYVLVCKFILRPNTFDLKDVNGKSNNEKCETGNEANFISERDGNMAYFNVFT